VERANNLTVPLEGPTREKRKGGERKGVAAHFPNSLSHGEREKEKGGKEKKYSKKLVSFHSITFISHPRQEREKRVGRERKRWRRKRKRERGKKEGD